MGPAGAAHRDGRVAGVGHGAAGSRYPTLARGELVPRESVRFPRCRRWRCRPTCPRVWRLDYGPQFPSAGIIAEPPRSGAPYTVLVPQVDADGNDRGGVPQLEVAVPLGTHTGWNVTVPALEDLRLSVRPDGILRAVRQNTRGARACRRPPAGRQRALPQPGGIPGPGSARPPATWCATASCWPRTWPRRRRGPMRCGRRWSRALPTR